MKRKKLTQFDIHNIFPKCQVALLWVIENIFSGSEIVLGIRVDCTVDATGSHERSLEVQL